ncbi:MAG: YkgJ family cysteine cluster protein [Polyangia bacterium]
MRQVNDSPLVREAYLLTTDLLSEPGRLDELHRELGALTHERCAPWSSAVACRAGCASCCHQDVVVFPFELIPLVANLDESPALRERLADYTAARAQRRFPPCPLLGPDHRCSVYDLRPSMCRSENSLSATACARGPGSHHPKVGEIFMVSIGVLFGACLASRDSGFDWSGYELHRALQHIFAAGSTPAQLEARWRSGERLLPASLATSPAKLPGRPVDLFRTRPRRSTERLLRQGLNGPALPASPPLVPLARLTQRRLR